MWAVLAAKLLDQGFQDSRKKCTLSAQAGFIKEIWWGQIRLPGISVRFAAEWHMFKSGCCAWTGGAKGLEPELRGRSFPQSDVLRAQDATF